MIFEEGGPNCFVLPGNPISHFVVFHLFVKNALQVLSEFKSQSFVMQVPASHDFSYKPNMRTTFVLQIMNEKWTLVGRSLAME